MSIPNTEWRKLGHLKSSEDSGKSRVGRYAACSGVSSKLEDKDGNLKGHVLQIDIDDFQGNIDDVFESAEFLPGVYLVTRTDTCSYNITSLNLFSWREVIDMKASLTLDDAEHLKVGIKRGYWILRLSGKDDRDRPKFERLKVVDGQSDSIQYSMPHLELYSKLYRDVGIYSALPEGEEVKGSLNLEHYATPVE